MEKKSDNSYTEKEYQEFVKLRDGCSLKGFDNLRRIMGRLAMAKFLGKFSCEIQKRMLQRDDKENGQN